MSRFAGLRLDVADLIEFAEQGDAQATELLQRLEQYEKRKEQQTTDELKRQVQTATAILAVPTLVNGRDTQPWIKLRDIAEGVIELLDPSEEVGE